ncbi:hypothetical protein [Antiquaquibacter soli]|uniref:Uncharacterized protein n=1 Tax=Antiquaquibacter soli TaxID=3064523 RepID=A0ABT9BPL8_9MICO|nr:hypothetical protein [Protaetiibacter sp. WY-16]MDO7882352.1 hypothetical protein [Protaetiibacter sp. WY-16]
MTRTFRLIDALALDDLHVFLGRALRVQDGSVRLIGGSGVLAVYVSVLHPAGLLDESPTVLGLRTFAIAPQDDFDAVVPVRSLLVRVEGQREAAGLADPSEGVTVTLPMEVNTVTWAAISPPRGGWLALGSLDGDLLESVARAGIDEVAQAVPGSAGEQIVHRVRTEVWGRTLDGHDNIPAGAAFAAVSLGFLSDGDSVCIFESGPWTRLTTKRGHVLVKRRAWNLAR